MVLGSALSSRAFQLNRGLKLGGWGGCSPSQKNTCENIGNKFVVSVKGGLGCWNCQCCNCEALLFVFKKEIEYQREVQMYAGSVGTQTHVVCKNIQYLVSDRTQRGRSYLL